MFAGLDDIDWAAMQHAYDPAVRETALDALYGAVHHQGDVYGCTLAAIPFLIEAAGNRGLPGRGAVLELVASIGGAERADVDDVHGTGDEDAEGGGEFVMFFAAARRAVAAECPLFLDLLADADPEVRRAAPTALLTCREDSGRVVAALQDRLAAEMDPAARAAIVAAVGKLATGDATGVDTAAVGAWLAELAARPGDPAFRLSTIAVLARSVPAALPPDVVSIAGELLRATYAAGSPPRRPAGFSTRTLIGSIREMFEREAADRRSPEATELVRSLSHALGEHVEERVRLLTELLRAPDWEARFDAIRPAKVLIEGWRGSFDELVALIGEQLLDPQPRLPALAAQALEHLGTLAAPAADALVRCVVAAPREAPHTRAGGLPAWVTTWPRDVPSVGPTVRALVGLRDARALPAVRWALERRDLPGDIGYVAGQLGPAAADLVPSIRRRLRELPPTDGHDRRRDGLIVALGQIGEAAAVPELLALLPEQQALTALGRIGSSATAAIPAVRGLLDHGEPAVEIAAASALWRLEADAGPVGPVLARHLDGDEHGARPAAQVVAEIGPDAAAFAPRLRALLSRTNASVWLRLRAAVALWRTTGDTETALPVLAGLWSENPYTREHVIRCFGEMGLAAAAMAPMVREELLRRRRHTAFDQGWASNQVSADLALLRACEAALASWP